MDATFENPFYDSVLVCLSEVSFHYKTFSICLTLSSSSFYYYYVQKHATFIHDIINFLAFLSGTASINCPSVTSNEFRNTVALFQMVLLLILF